MGNEQISDVVSKMVINARIGLLVPSSNTTMESEFWRMAPKGISIHVARMSLRNHTLEENLNMEKDAVKGAVDLKTAAVNLIVYGCTSGSFVGGPDAERKLTRNLEEAAGVPVITTTRAVIEALEAVRAKKIVIATPYPAEICQKEEDFLKKKFSILALKGLGIVDNLEVGRLMPDAAAKLANEIFVSEADAVFISCTNLRTIEIIEALESELGKPVVTSTQASMWLALKKLKFKEGLTGYGTLLRDFL